MKRKRDVLWHWSVHVLIQMKDRDLSLIISVLILYSLNPSGQATRVICSGKRICCSAPLQISCLIAVFKYEFSHRVPSDVLHPRCACKKRVMHIFSTVPGDIAGCKDE